MKVDYVDELIIVTQLMETNACPGYLGNIEIKDNSIFLIMTLASDDICDSQEVFKFTYIIKNPNKQKYTIAEIDMR